MKLVLIGAPGVGKGTQAKILAERYGLLHLSTGDILRNEIAHQTKLGVLAKTFIDEGKLVPDDIMLDMMEKRLQEEDVRGGYILDGFPRTLSQARGLETILHTLGQTLDAILALEGGPEVSIERLSSRRTCRRCGTITSLITDPRKEKDTCDLCGGELFQREDDTLEVIHERLDVYRNQTEPLIDYYSKNSLLRKVSGVGSIRQVTDNIIRELPEHLEEG